MTDPHPNPRALAEALEGALRETLNALEACTQGPSYRGVKLRVKLALQQTLAASQPPAVQGWADITFGEAAEEAGWSRHSVGSPEVSAIVDALNAIARRRFAERASGVEGGERG